MSGSILYLVGSGDGALAAQVALTAALHLGESRPGQFSPPAAFSGVPAESVQAFWVIFEARTADATDHAADAALSLSHVAELADRVDDIGWGRCLTEDLGSQYGRLTADAMLAVAFDVPQSEVTELEAFYAREHTPMLLHCPEWLRARLFATSSARGGTLSRLALHDLHGNRVFADPSVQASRSTAWMARMQQRPWFTGWPRTLSSRIKAEWT